MSSLPTCPSKMHSSHCQVGRPRRFHLLSVNSLVAQRIKRLPAMRETWVRSLGREDSLEKETATHSSILAWKMPWTEEPGGLQSTGSKESDTTAWLHYLHNNNHTDTRWCALCILHRLNLTTVLWGKVCCLVTKSCLTLCNLMDCSPPGSSVHGILQAGILEWGAISYSRDRTWVSCILCIGRQILYLCSTWEAMRQVLVFGPFPIKDPGAQRS